MRMRPRYYVHMGPRTADKVSLLWKGLHITIFILILISASIATWCVYKILEMYSFHCILYAKINFQDSYEQRMKNTTSEQNTTKITTTTTTENTENETPSKLNCTADPDNPLCKDENNPGRLLLGNINWKAHKHFEPNTTFFKKKFNNTGFINLRKTAFSTIYTCDLMFFSPLASIIMAVFLGALTIVGGKGGAGNPGDLFPNPWICVYPFLGLCGFMVIFSFIAQNLFYSGLNAFCNKYVSLTKEEGCCKKMDKYTIQFTPHSKGPQKDFYFNFFYGGITLEITSALWVLQALVYVFRILCLADFTTYLTRIRLLDDKRNIKDPKMANVVMKMVDKTKIKNF